MTDKVAEKSFLQRWSARKLDTEQDRGAPENDDVADLEEASVADAAPQTPPVDLPDVETLDAESDYTAFLGDNVPQDLAKLALRKLWRSDPVLANVDGLNDYDDDFSAVGMVSEAVKTVYKVGKGYINQEGEADIQDEVAVQDEGDTIEDEADETPASSEPADLEYADLEEPCPTVENVES